MRYNVLVLMIAVMAGGIGTANGQSLKDYTFSYRATMKIANVGKAEETQIFYWMEPDATYFGTEVVVDGGRGQMMVMDADVDGMVMFMDDGERKTAMMLNTNQPLMAGLPGKADEDAADAKVTPIDGKTILGYSCKGFRIETDKGISDVWVTEEAPVGMVNPAFGKDVMPAGLPDLGPKALLMEMEYTDKNRKGDKMRMECTELKQMALTIQKADYNIITSPLGGR